MRSAVVFVGTLLSSGLAGCIGGSDDPVDPAGLLGPSIPAPLCLAPCDVLVDGGAGTASEPTVAVDPNDPLHIVAGSIVWDPVAPGVTRSWLAVHVSWDGGATWVTGRLPGGPEAGPDHPRATATMSIGTPITPVEATRICCSRAPRRAPACFAIARASLSPWLPVHALALPEFTTIPRALPRRTWRLVTCIGAACTRLVVNTPAAATGRSAVTSATSGLRLRLIPAWIPDAANPAAAVTPPGTHFIAGPRLPERRASR
jgi:hypothetical protein